MVKDPEIEKLIDQLASPDAVIRELALKQLVEYSGKAVPLLTAQIDQPRGPAKDLVMQALAMIGDPSSAALFLVSLKDENARVRAMAAVGLVKLEHPEAINALITTLHDYGDETSPFTTSAYALIDQGVKALPKVISLLSSPSVYTREMGFRILAQIVTKIPNYRYDWEKLSHQMGNYAPDASPEIRQKAIKKWTEWANRLK